MIESAVWMVCGFHFIPLQFKFGMLNALFYIQMLHVWDHFDHTNDVDWWKTQGWPLVKAR